MYFVFLFFVAVPIITMRIHQKQTRNGTCTISKDATTNPFSMLFYRLLYLSQFPPGTQRTTKYLACVGVVGASNFSTTEQLLFASRKRAWGLRLAERARTRSERREGRRTEERKRERTSFTFCTTRRELANSCFLLSHLFFHSLSLLQFFLFVSHLALQIFIRIFSLSLIDQHSGHRLSR